MLAPLLHSWHGGEEGDASMAVRPDLGSTFSKVEMLYRHVPAEMRLGAKVRPSVRD